MIRPIIVDDGSTDGTAEACAMTDARVRLVALSHGGNVSRALNAAGRSRAVVQVLGAWTTRGP
jgi:glycosyltransferase involved in cell wall biosynthesis